MPQRYLVPQYIEMADKIVGPLTLVQFLYVLAGGILCYFFWTFFDKILSIPLSIIVGSFFLAMAFLKINDQPFPKMLLAAIFYLIKPKERVWKKIKEVPEIKVEDKHLKELPKIAGPKKEEVKSQLSQLATIVDARGWSKETGAEIGPGEEAFKMRVKSHEEIKPEIIPQIHESTRIDTNKGEK
jgi:hypothetical protein